MHSGGTACILQSLVGCRITPHLHLCQNSTDYSGTKKKKKKKLRPFSALFNPSILTPSSKHACFAHLEEKAQKASLSQRQVLPTELLLDLKWCSNLHRSVDFNRVYVLLKGQICFKHFIAPHLQVLMCFFFDLPTVLCTVSGIVRWCPNVRSLKMP